MGAATDVQALVGHWTGEYGSPNTGRAGSIDFTVYPSPHGDSASGVIMMVPAQFGQPLRPYRPPEVQGGPSTAMPTALTIHLVRIEGDRVHGDLMPYADPATGDRVLTTFDGRLAGDTIAGTFVSTPGPVVGGVTGQWRVVRERH
ncbi:MAG TPA: hypothetical protein VLT79_05300 [Gemmatimonadales bacterium]|nr:hypothetical protein [Gemmatimonadales bacterium]